MSAGWGSGTSMTVRPGKAAADRARRAPAAEAVARVSASRVDHERDGVGPGTLEGADAGDPPVPVADDAPAAGGGHLGDGERRHARVTSWARRVLPLPARRASPRPAQPEPRSAS